MRPHRNSSCPLSLRCSSSPHPPPAPSLEQNGRAHFMSSTKKAQHAPNGSLLTSHCLLCFRSGWDLASKCSALFRIIYLLSLPSEFCIVSYRHASPEMSRPTKFRKSRLPYSGLTFFSFPFFSPNLKPAPPCPSLFKARQLIIH